MASEVVYLIHWAYYICSFIAFALLFTRYRMWGAAWIAVLFLSQAIFHGCLIVDLQNYFRVREGLPPIENGLLTDRLAQSSFWQETWSYAVALASVSIVLLEALKDKSKLYERNELV